MKGYLWSLQESVAKSRAQTKHAWAFQVHVCAVGLCSLRMCCIWPGGLGEVGTAFPYDERISLPLPTVRKW